MDRQDGRALLLAVIAQAVHDARSGRACSCGLPRAPGDYNACSWDAHACAEDALRFLGSDACTEICRHLGVVHLLNRLPEATRVAPVVFVGA